MVHVRAGGEGAEFVSQALTLFKSLNRTVTCTRELISIYMCYPQCDGLNTSLSRLSYLVLYTILQLSSCPVIHLYLVFVRYQVPYVLDAHDERYINHVYLGISSPYVNPNVNSTPVPKC